MFSETIELRGHIIDSLILPKVLDQILTHGANFKIGEITIGQKRADQSFARIEVSAETSDALDELILRLRQHGAEVAERTDAQLAPAPADGVFPPEFYVMTNQQTFVRVDGKEIEVRPTMMDSAIAVDRNRPLFANWLRNFDARARRKAKSQLWPVQRSCGPVPISIWSGSLKAGTSIDFSQEIHLPVTTWNERYSALLWALASTWRSRAADARTLCARSMRFAKPAASPRLLR